MTYCLASFYLLASRFLGAAAAAVFFSAGKITQRNL
jgi:hypothetical protein